MKLIDTQPYERTESEIKAEMLLTGLNSELERRIDVHKNAFIDFWSDPKGILEAMGKNAAVFLMAASENVNHIANLAQISGKTLDDFLPEGSWKPRANIVVASDGSAAIKN